MTTKKRIGILFASASILLVSIWIPIFLGKDIVYKDITDRIYFTEGNRITQKQSAVTSEGWTLRSGTYHMVFSMTGTGPLQVFLSSHNCASLVPDLFVFNNENGKQQIDFTVYTEVDNLNIQLSGKEDTDIVINSISLSNYPARDRRFTISILIIAITAVSTLVLNGKLDRSRMSIGLLLLAVAFLASIPCFKDDLSVGDDLYYHWERLTGLIASLRSGQFPARVYPTMNNGYGGVAPVFYPDLFLYPLACLVIAGASMQYAFHLFIISINICTAFSMYLFSKKLVEDENIAISASMLYTLSTYRLTDLFTRSAFGETLAMTILPILLLFLFEVIWGNKKKWPLLSITAALLFRAHMITTLFAAILCMAICLCLIKTIFRNKGSIPLLLSITGAFLLCLPILLPLWTFVRTGVTARMMMRTTSLKAIEPAQLFFSSSTEMSGSWRNEHLLYRAIEIGVPILAGTAVYVYNEIKIPDVSERNIQLRILTVFGCLAAFMATTWFPWDRVDVLTKYISKYIQFPWRLLLVSICFFSISAAKGYTLFGEKSFVLVLVFCLAMALPLERSQTLNETIIPYGRTLEWMQLFGDYNFEGTVASDAANRDIKLIGNAELHEVHRAGDKMLVKLQTGEETTVILPLYAFEGYLVKFNNEEINTFKGDKNRLSLILPGGVQGELSVQYVGKSIWRLGEAIGFLTFVILLICIKRNQYSTSQKLLG